ncbi:helix-turn-helix transcriptional regulator [Paenibacillus sp. GCM10012307]|uniref:helix-turn-helix transcriptional regulator n=1 Tax=Paenibacillus TaxID=44249 RepID=UPI001E2D336A|nr:WYL domain-containing protein [Paenibacillus roseus]
MKLIKQAIEQLHLISFTYVNVKGEASVRTVEPYTLIMKGQQWYLYAYCPMRSGFRMFKLNRIKELTTTDRVYLRRPLPEEPLPWDADWYREENLAHVQLRIFPPARQIAEEWFGVDQLDKEENGNSWLSPPHIRRIIQDKAQAIAARYAKTNI